MPVVKKSPMHRFDELCDMTMLIPNRLGVFSTEDALHPKCLALNFCLENFSYDVIVSFLKYSPKKVFNRTLEMSKDAEYEFGFL